MTQTNTDAWKNAWAEYEAGKEYKHRIGLYDTVRRNERFYRGDQWYGSHTDLPHPVFNLVRRVTDYLVSSAMPGGLTVRYSDVSLPFADRAALRKKVTQGLDMFNRHARWRWKQTKMESLVSGALLDAAVTGDGIFYCWWDPDARDGQPFSGDIRTERADNTDLFVADPASDDLQSQDYLILAGHATVASLRREAEKAGVPKAAVGKILPDGESDLSDGQPADPNSTEKATFLLRFWKEGGTVRFEKSTRNCLIRRCDTGLKYYPVAYFHWNTAKHSYIGNAPVSDMIANQKYLNTAYALAMKHMTDTAFSKVVYDKSKIPEWSNEVGEAIAAVGGGNVADAVSVVGVGKMQDGYLELIDSVIDNTKNMMGATDAALGDAAANNTSALLVLQQASSLTLEHVRVNLHRCIGELALIWADMLCTYCPAERQLALLNEDGSITTGSPDYKALKRAYLTAGTETEAADKYTPSATVSVLDKLLDGGHITVRQYLRSLPEGVLTDREAILRQIPKGDSENE